MCLGRFMELSLTSVTCKMMTVTTGCYCVFVSLRNSSVEVSTMMGLGGELLGVT